MHKPRIIPVLLIHDEGLVKGKNFSDYRYLGDPMNAVRIFNEKKVDELIFLDINCLNSESINRDLVQNIADECFMPFAVGGGIKTLEQIKHLLRAGAEKVVINSSIYENPQLIKDASDYFGSQSIIVSLDVKKSFFGNYVLYSHSGKKKVSKDLVEYVSFVERLGAGEIMVTNIDYEGMQNGYDLNLISKLASVIKIPLIASGGAGNISHLIDAVKKSKADSVAASSLFVYHGKNNAVLINYLSDSDKAYFLDSIKNN